MSDNVNDEITTVAYELYEKSNRKEGNDLLNWLAAEKIVRFRKMLLPDSGAEAITLLEYKPLQDDQPGRPEMGKPRPRSRKAAKPRHQAQARAGL